MTIAYVNGTIAIDTSISDTVVTAVPAGTLDGHAMLGYMSYFDDLAVAFSLFGGTLIMEKADTDGSDTAVAAEHRIASSEPANYTFDGGVVTPISSSKVGIIAAFSGVHTDVLDVAYVEANHYQKDLNDTTPTPKPITTITNGAVVVIIGYTKDGNVTALGAPTGYTSRLTTVGANRNVILATKLIATAGLETPGAWQHTDIGALDETVSLTFALKAAATGSIINQLQGSNVGADLYNGALQ